MAVLVDVPDLDALMAAMATQEAADAMEHDGVLADTVVFLVETEPFSPGKAGKNASRSRVALTTRAVALNTTRAP